MSTTTVRHRARPWLRVVAAAVLGAAVVTVAPSEATAASTCQTSGPAGGLYAVNVCIDAPADGAVVTGDTPVTGSVTTASGSSPGVQRMVFYLGGQYLLTDYQAPYTFTIPTAKFVDGAKTLEVEALMRDTFVTSRTSIGLTFNNGVTTPPTNTGSWTPTPGTNPVAGQAFTVAAVGDGAGGDTSETDVANLISGWNPNLVLYLGDVYEKGTPTEFYNWYRPESQAGTFFGRFRSITDPTVGNHEYQNGQAPGYFDYWDNIPHYYSVNTHGWHVVSLDTNAAYNQTATTSAQYQWLVDDLNANTQPCTLVMYHQPLFNIGDEGSTTSVSAIWSLLAQHSVDLVVNGHDHTYQRWAPLDGAGNPSPTGVTELVDGTGGHALGSFPTSDPRVASSSIAYGAMRLTLNPDGASYQYTSTAGITLDSGSVRCDPTAADTSAPTVPTDLTASSTYKTRIDLAWTPSVDNVGVTSYEVWRDGALLDSVSGTTTFADTTVTPGSTHSYQVRAKDAAGNLSALSSAATATTPTISVLFHDGFESGDLSSWINPAPVTNPANSGLTAQQSEVFAGAWGASAVSTGSGTSAWRALSASETNLYYVARFKALSHNSTVNLMRFRTTGAGAGSLATLSLSTTNRLVLRNDVAGVAATSLTSAALGAWHTAQFHIAVNGAASTTEVWLDGTPVGDLSLTTNLGTNPIGRIELGDTNSSTTPRAYNVAFDEVAFDREMIGDVTPPSAPTGLSATAHSGLRVDLSWTAATDDTGISGYDVYRNGQVIASIPASASYADTSVSPLTSYTYKLLAKDAAGNVSGFSNSVGLTTPEVFTDGFESGTVSKWTAAGLTAQQAEVDTGSWAARATSTGSAGASAQTTLDAGIGEMYYRTRFKILSQGSNSVSLARVRTAANGSLASAFVSSTGRLSYRNDTNASTVTSAQTVSKNLWHELQVHVTVNGSSSLVDLWLDGVSAVSTTDTLGTSPIARLELGDPSTGRTFDVAFDNVVANRTFIADAGAPSVPGNLRVTSVTGQAVNLAWDPATDDVGVTTYRVYRGGSAIADVDGGQATYSDTTVSDATAYTYTVTALDAVNHESAPSNPVQATTSDATKPSTPTGVSATAAAGVNSITVTWGASTDNVAVTGYRIYRSDVSAPVGSVDGSVRTYTDTTVQGSTSYTYTVTAVDAAGNESDPSTLVTVTSSDTVKPTAPATVTASTVSDTQVNITWAAGTDNVSVTAYRVFRNGTQVGTVQAPALAYSDTAASADTTYAYSVRSVDAAGNVSDASASASATTLVFTDGFESGNLSKWTTVAGLAAETTLAYTGTWGAEAASGKNTSDYAVRQLPSTATDLYYRGRVQITTGKPDQVDMLELRNGSGNRVVALFYDSKRRLGYVNGVTNRSTASTTTLNVGVWYEVKLHVTVNGASSQVEVWLNGTKVTALSKTENFGTTPIGQVVAGESQTGHAYGYVLDDIWVSRQP